VIMEPKIIKQSQVKPYTENLFFLIKDKQKLKLKEVLKVIKSSLKKLFPYVLLVIKKIEKIIKIFFYY